LRDDPQTIARQVLVPIAGGSGIPLGQVARLKLEQGPSTIRTEDAQLAAYVFVDVRDRDLGSYVADARAAVARAVKFPPGVYPIWSGQFEYLERAEAKLMIVVPLTLVIIFMLLYLNFGRLAEALIVLASVPFALVGGLWLMYGLGFNFSVAVAVGFIALAGVAAETGVVMLIYLDSAFRARAARASAEGRSVSTDDITTAVMEGAVERVRPKLMTVTAIMAGLLPIMWSTGAGSEIMQRIAVPMIGGMASSTILTLIVIPAIYSLVKGAALATAPQSHRSQDRMQARSLET
jgi:Cu(I)/Ag(I) efflux system membrane protein CusA/SilA